MTIFHAFCQKKETVAFPEMSFDLTGTSSTEKEESIRYKNGEKISCFDQGSKAVNAKTYISTSTDKIDTRELLWIGISKQ